jgi:hypothetical protein
MLKAVDLSRVALANLEPEPSSLIQEFHWHARVTG